MILAGCGQLASGEIGTGDAVRPSSGVLGSDRSGEVSTVVRVTGGAGAARRFRGTEGRPRLPCTVSGTADRGVFVIWRITSRARLSASRSLLAASALHAVKRSWFAPLVFQVSVNLSWDHVGDRCVLHTSPPLVGFCRFWSPVAPELDSSGATCIPRAQGRVQVNDSKWELVVGGGLLVFVVVATAVVIIGLKALERARREDVPAVVDSMMRVLRDSRLAAQRRGYQEPYRLIEQPRAEEGGEKR